jgi:hypothetical protein
MLRDDAALKIAKCLELKEYEKREGAPESNTIGYVATKIAWQALGRINSDEGRELARVVKTAVDHIYKSPMGVPPGRDHAVFPGPQTGFIATYASALCGSNVSAQHVHQYGA